jgi:23S rRNA pseudouridine1911/1915/1917 synthase
VPKPKPNSKLKPPDAQTQRSSTADAARASSDRANTTAGVNAKNAKAHSDAAADVDEVVSISGGVDVQDNSRRLQFGPGGKIDAESVRRLLERQSNEDSESDGDEELRRISFTLQHDLQKRLDKYLVDRIAFMSRTALQRLIDEGGVLVNQRVPKASTLLRAGDVVEVVVPPPPEKNVQPEDIPLDVLYEDEHLIVVNKHPDILVHPARSHLKGTMLSALEFHFRHRSKTGGSLSKVGENFARPGVVHRLDRHTSGCIVFAKQEETHWKIGHQFERRTVEKRYITVVHGRLEPATDVIEAPIGSHPSREKGFREKYVVRHDAMGKPATTIYRVREWYHWSAAEAARATSVGENAARVQDSAPAGSVGTGHPGVAGTVSTSVQQGWKAALPSLRIGMMSAAASVLPGAVALSPNYSLVEIELKTGRTHQIRVHLSHGGNAIVGDDMYGGRPFPPGTVRPKDGESVSTGQSPIIAHPALHAALLAFNHPITGERMTFTAPLRGEIARLVHALRKGSRVEHPDVPGCIVNMDQMMSRLNEP